MKAESASQPSLFIRPVVKSKYATTPSSETVLLLAKRKRKNIKDGELSKEAMISGTDYLLGGFANKPEIMSSVKRSTTVW